MNKIIRPTIYFIFLLLITQVKTKTLTISDCFSLIEKNYPLIENENLFEENSDFGQKAIKKEWLPQISLSGKATYQSETISLPLNMPNMNITVPDNDSYNLTLDLTQKLFDGFISREREKNVLTTRMIDSFDNQIKLYKVKVKAFDLFFAIVISKERSKIIEINLKTLQDQLEAINSGIDNGVFSRENELIMKANILKLENKKINLLSDYKKYRNTLSLLIGEKINSKTEFILPDTDEKVTFSKAKRPESGLFKFQRQKMETLAAISKKMNFPKISSFARFSYGKPGLNLLSNEFNTNYILGITFKMDIWNWRINRDKANSLLNREKILGNEQKAFDLNLQTEFEEIEEEIISLKKKIEKDSEIVKYYEELLSIIKEKLNFGTITNTEYMTNFNQLVEEKQVKKIDDLILKKLIALQKILVGETP